MCEAPSWRLELWLLPPTPHKHLYLWSDHCTKDAQWSLFKVFNFSHHRLNLTELRVKNGEERKSNPTENYYYLLDLKKIASMDPGKSYDYFIVCLYKCEIHDSSRS